LLTPPISSCFCYLTLHKDSEYNKNINYETDHFYSGCSDPDDGLLLTTAAKRLDFLDKAGLKNTGRFFPGSDVAPLGNILYNHKNQD